MRSRWSTIGLAALLSLLVGLGLTPLIQRLPRQMECDWQSGAAAASVAGVALPIALLGGFY